jgi:hypothetical protein
MKYDELASRIRSLIVEEQFEDALGLLPAYAEAVTKEALANEEFSRARDFLTAACKSVKSRRAHYIAQIGSLAGNRAYCSLASISSPSPSCDVLG